MRLNGNFYWSLLRLRYFSREKDPEILQMLVYPESLASVCSDNTVDVPDFPQKCRAEPRNVIQEEMTSRTHRCSLGIFSRSRHVSSQNSP